MTETKQTELKNDIGAKLIIYRAACERTTSFKERLQLTEELATELATATQQAVEGERERIKLIIREHERADGEIEMYVDDLFMAIHGYRVLALSKKGLDAK